MTKILAFSGSFSSDSINHQLVEYASSKIGTASVSVIRLSDFEAPIYTKEREREFGFPTPIEDLRKLFDEADGFILSTPEYNGSVPAGLKNTLDWISRMEGKIFQDKPVLLMAASPGGRGGKSVLDHLTTVLPFWGAKLIGPFGLPLFQQNFESGLLKEPFDTELQKLIFQFEEAL